MVRIRLAGGIIMMYFTIDEAEKCIPKIERLVRKAQHLRDKIAWLLETNDVVLEVSSDEGFHYFMTEQIRTNKEFHRLYYQFYRVIEQLGAMNVIIKDIDDGFVDFPFRFNGRDAFLSWQLGEEKIRFWHDGEERRPILDFDALFEGKSLY